MTSENVLQANAAQKIRLKRSASVSNVMIEKFTTLNLRDTKSFSGNMEEFNSAQNKFLKKIEGNEKPVRSADTIETLDLYNNSVVIMPKEILKHKGKNYSINNIAFRWKKDCRMWLWKNSKEVLENRSVGDHVKAELKDGSKKTSLN